MERDSTSTEPLAGRYRLLEQIGEGAMGVVFAAYDPELDRKVALKLLHMDPTEGASQQGARLMSEAQAMAKLAHPNVVSIYDVGGAGARLFVAMELVTGQTLSRWLLGSRTREEILGVFVQAGRGLAAAHSVGLVHRDFKPDNVLVGADGRARVTDFGLSKPVGVNWAAKAQSPLQAVPLSTATTRSVSGALEGTPAYMAPETFWGEPATTLSDQYSFAASLYEALFKLLPSEGESLKEFARNVTAGKRRPFPSDAPKWLRQVLTRALALNPRDRFQSMEALLSELSRERGVRRRSIALAVVLAAASATLVFAQSGGEETKRWNPVPSQVILRPCADFDLKMSDVWTADRRASYLRGGFFEGEKSASDRLVSSIDAFAAKWEKTRGDFCESVRTPAQIEKSQLPVAKINSRFVRCMRGSARDLDALLRARTTSGSYTIANTLRGVLLLASPELCGQGEWLRFVPDPPIAKEAARSDQMSSDAAYMIALVESDERFQAQPIFTELAKEFDQVGDLATKAFVGYALGRFKWAMRDYEAALPYFFASVEHAHTVGDFALEAKSAAAVGELVGVQALSLDTAEKWLRIATVATDSRPILAATSAAVYEVRGRVLAKQLELEKALVAFERAHRLRLGPNGGGDYATAETESQLAALLIQLEEGKRSIETAQSSVARAVTVMGPAHPRVAYFHEVLGRAYLATDRRGEARSAFAAAEKSAHDFFSVGLTDGASLDDALGDLALASGDYEVAEKYYSDALSIRRGAIIPDHPDIAVSLSNLAVLERSRGNAKLALSRQREALVAAEAFYGPKNVHLWVPLLQLSRALRAANLSAEAAKIVERTVSVLGPVGPNGSTGSIAGHVLREQGLVTLLRGDAKGALEALDDASTSWIGVYPTNHSLVIALLIDRATAAERAGELGQAQRYLSAAVGHYENLYGKYDARTVKLRQRAERLR